jgi:hypothetical protein
MAASRHDIALYHSSGAAEIQVSQECRRRLRAALDVDRAVWPIQDELSGLHNPFGRAAKTVDSWTLLDIAEKGEIAESVLALLGPDVILWDSELYAQGSLLAKCWPDERYYWPVLPLAGLIVAIPLSARPAPVLFIDIARLAADSGARLPAGAPVYALRYMPATAHFNRDPHFEPNRRAAEQRPLVNHANRPIWLIHGEDHGGNDLVAGFAPTTLSWASSGSAAQLQSMDNQRKSGGSACPS